MLTERGQNLDALEALKLQLDWGADESLDDTPIDRLAAPPPPPPVLRALPAGPKLSQVGHAQVAAEGANTPEALRQALAAFTQCGLAATATSLVFADGVASAGLVVVGEVPGPEEDRAGRPFVGPAGQLLDRMFASIGLRRTDMLLTSLVPWRPPGGRPPTEAEVQMCAPFLWRHLTLLRPRLVVALGTLPARTLTGRDETIRRLRGRWVPVSVPGLPQAIQVLPMFNPLHVLNTPASRKDMWTDLLTLRKALNAL